MKESDNHMAALNQERKRKKMSSTDPMDRQFSNGCDWSGLLCELNPHLERECSHTLLSCPNDECDAVYRRKDEVRHLQECKLRRGNECRIFNIL